MRHHTDIWWSRSLSCLLSQKRDLETYDGEYAFSAKPCWVLAYHSPSLPHERLPSRLSAQRLADDRMLPAPGTTALDAHQSRTPSPTRRLAQLTTQRVAAPRSSRFSPVAHPPPYACDCSPARRLRVRVGHNDPSKGHWHFDRNRMSHVRHVVGRRHWCRCSFWRLDLARLVGRMGDA